MKKKLFVLAALLCVLFDVRAHPYASGITNKNGTISWVLNESASDVTISFDNGTTINDLGSAPAVGTNTFSLGTHTNFSITVYKAGSGALNQISSDSKTNNGFYGPRGVSVNRNPKTWNFGRIYIANASAGSPSSAGYSSRTNITTRGLFVLDAASGDFLNQGSNGITAGITLGTSTTYSPYKVFVGPDDYLYVGDSSVGNIGGVWMVNPNLTVSSNLFPIANPNTNALTAATNYGQVIGTPNVTGSYAAGTLSLSVVMWDLNLVNPPGTYSPHTQTNYNQIYQYNIGGGLLPWKSFPTVVTNPISLGNFNTVTMDAYFAPDGKYFICADRNSPSDGATNVCVLSSAGTLLWDSRTQSKNYFGDSTYDHTYASPPGVSVAGDYGIAVSPDDKYVAILGGDNNVFIWMKLTNGVPDISTIATNTVSANGGTTSRSVAFDSADNIYVVSGGSDTLRIFSLGLTSLCTTTNDATGTNGSFQLIAVSPTTLAVMVSPINQTGQCTSNVTFSVYASGAAPLSYQWNVGGVPIPNATNATFTLTDVDPSQSGGSFTAVVTNSSGSVTSQVAVLTVVDTLPPVVTLNGSATMNISQNSTFNDPGATAADACAGSLSVTTSGSVNTSVPATYIVSYAATDPSNNSATNTRTVVVSSSTAFPTIAQGPTNQTAQCAGSDTMIVTVNGTSPFYYQWYRGAAALSDGIGVTGSSSSSLNLSTLALAQSGSYSVIVTNTYGSATSQVAVLTVVDTTPPVVSLMGAATYNLGQGSSFTDPGATAHDACAGSLSVTTTGSVNVNVTGAYILNYSATDPSGNSATNSRIVYVYPTNLPAMWTMFPGSPVGDSGDGETGDGTRSDDIYFVDQNTGWASRDTRVYKTIDGGNTWNLMFTAPTNAHFRSISFLNSWHGFAGNLGPGSYDGAVADTNVLYETFDGGTNWHVFHGGLNEAGMKGFCAMYILDSQHIYGGGRVRGPAFFVKSVDGGTNWTSVNLTAAGVMNGIMDVYFHDQTNGWVCGMDTNSYSSSCSPTYHGCIAHTTDGGATWTPVVNSPLGCCYFWKMSWPSSNVGYCSLQQNGTISAIIYYKTINGGQTWVSNGVPISVVDSCAFYLQGIGFADTNTGWMGGGSCGTQAENFVQTLDGGATWTQAGYFDTSHMNRMRFVNSGWGYAAGFGLHHYASPLAITNQFQNQSINFGSSTAFQVSISTLTTAGYQWQKNGTNIAGATTSALNLSSVSHNDQATYSVVVTNSYGTISSPNFTLTVAEPLIGSEPTNQSVSCGSQTSLAVSATGSSPLTYQWYLGANTVPQATNATLQFTNITVAANGSYTVVVTTPYGTATSTVATITVAGSGTPVLTVVGATTTNIECHAAFTDPGATASDACAGNLTPVTTGNLNVNVLGTYILTYTATDPSSNSASGTRTITVVDTTPPVITLNGYVNNTLILGTAFTDPGATANDACAGSLSVTTAGSVDINVSGTYLLTYSATDPSGHSAAAIRTVNIYPTNLPPIWTMFPGSPVGDSGNGESGDGTRSDDIYFVDQNTGWASRDTRIYKTVDGGNTWNLMFTSPTNAHFRSISFLNSWHGFAGNLGPGSYDGAVADTNVLYETFDGGTNWHVFHGGLNEAGMKGFCAMYILDSQHIYGGGRVRGPAFFVKSVDGGTNWTVVNLTAANVMNAIMDVYFHDPTNGWLCGMDTNVYNVNCTPTHHGCIARTTDGGATWTPVVSNTLACCYFWKMSWPSTNVGYCSLQQDANIENIIYYKTVDGGNTWVSNGVPISVVGGCSFYLQGIGFVDTNTGWMGGASCGTQLENFVQTIDGGATWTPAGYFDTSHMNRLRFPSTNWGYAAGFGLHLYHSPLGITNQPISQIASGGGSVQFSAGAASIGSATYQWQQNGVNLSGATSTTLTLNNLNRTNEGNYSLVVSNAYGVVTSADASLRVYVAQLLMPPQPFGTGFHLSFGDSDGSPLNINDLPNFELDGLTNIGSAWQPLSLPFTLSNGMVQVYDPSSNFLQLYRVIEH